MSDVRKPAWKKTEAIREPILRPLEVEVRNNDIEDAIKVLRHKMSKDGLLAELKEKRYYEKPSEKRIRKEREGIKKLNKSRGKKARQRVENRKKQER